MSDRQRIEFNPIVCDGRGLCAEILPERIELDDWGFPIVSKDPLDRHTMPNARRACAACPVGALRIVADTDK